MSDFDRQLQIVRTSMQEPSDVDAVLSALKFNGKWLIEIATHDPASLVGREVELYDIMNAMQWVTSKFARVA